MPTLLSRQHGSGPDPGESSQRLPRYRVVVAAPDPGESSQRLPCYRVNMVAAQTPESPVNVYLGIASIW